MLVENIQACFSNFNHYSLQKLCRQPIKIDPTLQVEIETAIRIDATVDQRREAAIVFRRHPCCPFRFHQDGLRMRVFT